jgi:acyl-CoA synthetase (AMP-forming)/AMP-acid ligase II
MPGSSYQMTLGSALARTASKFPEKIALQDNRIKLTYRKFNQRVNRLANALLGLGLVKGDRIAILSSNCTGLMELFMGALKTGIIPCPLDVRGTLDDQIPHLKWTPSKNNTFVF